MEVERPNLSSQCYTIIENTWNKKLENENDGLSSFVELCDIEYVGNGVFSRNRIGADCFMAKYWDICAFATVSLMYCLLKKYLKNAKKMKLGHVREGERAEVCTSSKLVTTVPDLRRCIQSVHQVSTSCYSRKVQMARRYSQMNVGGIMDLNGSQLLVKFLSVETFYIEQAFLKQKMVCCKLEYETKNLMLTRIFETLLGIPDCFNDDSGQSCFSGDEAYEELWDDYFEEYPFTEYRTEDLHMGISSCISVE